MDYNKDKHSQTYSLFFNEDIYQLIPSNKTVLDVGCNTGFLGQKVIHDKGCKVWGVDASQKAIDIARTKLTRAEVVNLEEYEMPFPEDRFDVILFADILEHVQFPKRVLNNYSKMLKKDGIIIASIPNVANIKVRMRLLFGKFDYKETGILDKSHLRFFTLKTIRILFEDFSIKEIRSTPGFKFFILRYFKLLDSISNHLCKIYPKLFALQFIIVAEKSDD